VKFGRHDARQSFLEGVLARCDRRAGRLLLEAHRLGCRFDGWTERLNWDAWQEAFSRWGMKPDEQIRARSLEETLPWDHIDTLVSKDWLKEDCLRARRSEWQSDCRSGRCNRCGVMESQRGLCQGMLERGRTEVRQESEPAVGTLQRPPEPQPAAKIRLRFARRGPVRFLSHLEMVSVFLRAIRRARIPVSYSQGFSPSPRVAFSCALPVGFETEGDYLDMLLRESVSAPDVQRRLNQALPAGFEALNSAEVPVQAPALMSAVVAERYLATLVGVEKAVIEAASGAAQSFGSREALWVEKTNKKGKVRQENILPSIRELAVRRADEAGLSLELLLVQQEGVKAGAREVLAAICPEIDWARWRVRKLESYVSTDTGLADPLSAYRDASSQAQGNA
jgi:radical SAM-linked protein